MEALLVHHCWNVGYFVLHPAGLCCSLVGVNRLTHKYFNQLFKQHFRVKNTKFNYQNCITWLIVLMIHQMWHKAMTCLKHAAMLLADSECIFRSKHSRPREKSAKNERIGEWKGRRRSPSKHSSKRSKLSTLLKLRRWKEEKTEEKQNLGNDFKHNRKTVFVNAARGVEKKQRERKLKVFYYISLPSKMFLLFLCSSRAVFKSLVIFH